MFGTVSISTVRGGGQNIVRLAQRELRERKPDQKREAVATANPLGSVASTTTLPVTAAAILAEGWPCPHPRVKRTSTVRHLGSYIYYCVIKKIVVLIEYGCWISANIAREAIDRDQPISIGLHRIGR